LSSSSSSLFYEISFILSLFTTSSFANTFIIELISLIYLAFVGKVSSSLDYLSFLGLNLLKLNFSKSLYKIGTLVLYITECFYYLLKYSELS